MPWPNGYTYKRQVTFDHTQCGTADQTNFPALIGAQGALSYLATVANGGKVNNTVAVNGVTVPADLIFTSDSAGSTLLSWEIAYYNASTGAIEIWVNLPTLNHLTTDTKIYMWYGAPSVTTYQCTPSATWNSDFQAVYHGGDGSTLNLNDSTSHARTLTNHSATAHAGPVIGGAFSVVSATPSYLDTGYTSPTGSFTIEGWVNFTGSFGANYRYWFSSFSSGTLAGIAAAIQGTVSKRLTVQCANAGAVTECSDLTTRSTSTWYQVTITYDGGNLRIFVNGSLLNTIAYGGQSVGSKFVIGGDGDFAGSVGSVDWDGYIDEVRFSTVARNSDWYAPSYNNTKPSSTFVTIGAEDVSNIQPTGLASAFAAGTPLLGGGAIIPTGLPSAFASGLPQIAELNTLFPVGLPTGIAVGVPLLGGGAILPTGLPSAGATGTPTILEQQLVGPTGLSSGFAAGTPSVHHSQTVMPAGLPSREAAGTPNISAGVQKIVIPGLPPGLAGIPTIVGGANDITLWIANVSRNAASSGWLRAETLNVRSQTIGRSTATFDVYVDNAGDFVPLLGQTVILVDYGNKVFAGCLNSVINDRQISTDHVVYHCTAADKSSICDHRVINKIYPAGSEAADVVRDIVNLALNGEGITTQGVPATIATLSSDLNCTFYTVTQAFDAITNDVGGIWWIDFNGVLYFTPLSALPACPISLSENSYNWRNLTVETTLLGYANKWYANSNLNVLPGTGNNSGGGPPVVTETYTLPQAAAVARDFYFGALVLNYSTVQILSLKVNGVQQPIHGGLESINFQKSWWYFAGDPYVTPPNASNNNPYYPYPPVTSAYPVPGDVVEISYIPVAQNVAVTPGPPLSPAFGTCGSGIYEAVAQVQNVSYQGDLDQISAKLLAKYSQIPTILRFQTDYPGIAVGQLISVNLPKSDLPTTTLFITAISGVSLAENLGFNGTMRWDVTAATNVDLGNWIKWFERLVGQTENPLPLYQYEDPNWVLGPGGSVSAGVVDSNPYTVKRTGKLIKAVFTATTPATNQDMYIDLQTQNGSIFSSPMKIPAGTAAFAKVEWTAFFNDPGGVGYPSYVYQGDVFRPPIVTYAATGPNPTTAANATLALVWQI